MWRVSFDDVIHSSIPGLKPSFSTYIHTYIHTYVHTYIHTNLYSATGESFPAPNGTLISSATSAGLTITSNTQGDRPHSVNIFHVQHYVLAGAKHAIMNLQENTKTRTYSCYYSANIWHTFFTYSAKSVHRKSPALSRTTKNTASLLAAAISTTKHDKILTIFSQLWYEMLVQCAPKRWHQSA